MTEAFLAVHEAAQRQAHLLRLSQEILRQVAGSEVPEVSAVGEGVRDVQQGRLFAAVAGQGERGDTGDVNGVAAGQDAVQDLRLGAQNAGSLHVDDDFAAGELFDLRLEVGRDLADDGVNRVDLSVGQGDGFCGRSGAGEHQSEGRNESEKLLHSGFLLFLFR